MVNGYKQRDYILKDDVSSPTVSAEAVMLTCVINAIKGRDVTVINVPNAFVQTVGRGSGTEASHQLFFLGRGPKFCSS